MNIPSFNVLNTSKEKLVRTIQDLCRATNEGEKKVKIVNVASGTTAITCEVGNYYSIAGSVGTLAITLPSMSDSTSLSGLTIGLTTGSTPSITITSADNKTISYFSGYSIEDNKEYELKFLFNGTKWIVDYATIG